MSSLCIYGKWTPSEGHVARTEINIPLFSLSFWRRNYFFNLAHPVYKMWIIQEPNMLELWNKLHFEEKKTETIYHV